MSKKDRTVIVHFTTVDNTNHCATQVTLCEAWIQLHFGMTKIQFEEAIVDEAVKKIWGDGASWAPSFMTIIDTDPTVMPHLSHTNFGWVIDNAAMPRRIASEKLTWWIENVD